jgi:bis(5'-nucleosyl)-tetraphosphatase (symmetrical)
VRSLGERAVTVLGNHDFHLVAQFEGLERAREGDTLDRVLAAPDAKLLVDWLRRRPMMHASAKHALVHAGLLPQWSVAKALELAREVERALAAPTYREFLGCLYGSEPDRWSDALEGWDRLRVIVNAMTRLRFCSSEGRMEFHAKGTRPPDGYEPWFDLRAGDAHTLICGHWSALGLKLAPRLAALDSGCVWGGSLSALRLEDRSLYQVPCHGYQQAEE